MLAEGCLQLAVLNEAVAGVVKRVKGRVDLLLGSVVAQRSDRLAELLLVDGAVAILIPLAEKIDQLHAVLRQNAVHLVGDAHTR